MRVYEAEIHSALCAVYTGWAKKAEPQTPDHNSVKS